MPDDFNIPSKKWPDEPKGFDTQIREILEERETTRTAGRHIIPMPAMTAIATNVWKAKSKMLDAVSGEVREEMKRVYRHVEAALENLREIGFEVKDHTGDTFDYGQSLKVITTQPTQGITRETVIETIKPTIYWQQQLVQTGEVVIATPAAPDQSHE
jgi:hypothetical protein